MALLKCLLKHLMLSRPGITCAAGGVVRLAAALISPWWNSIVVMPDAIHVLSKLVQEDVSGHEQADHSPTLLAGLQGLRNCSACLEPALHSRSCKQATVQGRVPYLACTYGIKVHLGPEKKHGPILSTAQDCNHSCCHNDWHMSSVRSHAVMI